MDIKEILKILQNYEKKSLHDIILIDYNPESEKFNIINGNFEKIKEYAENEGITKNIAFLGDSFILYEKGD